MAVDYLQSGKIKPILYFINDKGYVYLLPTDEESKRFRKHMRKLGFELQEADSLDAARKLEKKLQVQLYQEQQQELAKDEVMTRYRRQQVRDRLYLRMQSADTTQTEKDFIACYLQWRENKHEMFKKRFTGQFGNLDALNFDNPDKHIHELHDRVPDSGE